MELVDLKKIVRSVFEDLSKGGTREPGTQENLILDDERGHYQLLGVGWTDSRRAFDVYAHVDIQDGLIWVQVDNTDRGIADELVRLGVPKHCIVLGFQSPFKRKFTEFSTGGAD
jgi:XisI protein